MVFKQLLVCPPRYKFLVVLSIGLCFLFLLGQNKIGFNLLDQLNFKLYDLLHRGLPFITPSGKVVLVALLEKQRQLGREHYGELVRKIAEAGAKVIAIDVRFPEEKEKLADDAFVEAVKRTGNVILVEDVYVKGEKFIRRRPFAKLSYEAKDIGAPFLRQDQDQVIRGVQLYKDDIKLGSPFVAFPALVYRELIASNGESNIIFKKNRSKIYFNSAFIPVDQNNYLFIRFTWNFIPKMTYDEVMNGDNLTPFFQDKAAIIYMEGDVHDRFLVPFAPGHAAYKNNKLPGGVIHAMVVETMLSRQFILPKFLMESLWAFFAAVLLPAVFMRYSLFRSLTISAGLCVIITATSLIAMYLLKWWIPIVLPLAWIIIYCCIVILYDFVIARGFFAQFVPLREMEQILQHGKVSHDLLKINATILFSDLRGYSTWTEQADSTVVMEQLREYVQCVLSIVSHFKGEMLDYQGDGSMAIFTGKSKFGNHAIEGAKAALDIYAAFKELTKQWQKEKKKELDIGIGLSSGEVTYGIIGESAHRQFVAVGDSTNIAARLQGLSQVLGSPIIISGSTVQSAGGSLIVEFLENSMLKGKQKPVPAYRLIDVLSNL